MPTYCVTPLGALLQLYYTYYNYTLYYLGREESLKVGLDGICELAWEELIKKIMQKKSRKNKLNIRCLVFVF